MRLAVGAPACDNQRGLVRIYDLNGTNWTLSGELVGEAIYDECGTSVALRSQPRWHASRDRRLCILSAQISGGHDASSEARVERRRDVVEQCVREESANAIHRCYW